MYLCSTTKLIGDTVHKQIYYIHFEITGDPSNLTSPHWYDLFINYTIFSCK